MRGSGTKPSLDASSQPWWIRDLLLAAGFLTRVPLPAFDPGDRRLSRTGWCFPLVGAAIGAAGGLLALGALAFGLPVLACALAGLAGTALLTGALHEDGLADLADGFGGGRDKNAKISIMRDSRIGAYGVLALILATGLKASAIAAIVGDGDAAHVVIAMAIAHAGARGLIPPVTFWLPNASEEGLGAMAGQAKRSTVQIAMAIPAALLLILLPFSTAIMAGAAGCLAAAAIATLARRQIGGYTGDVLGAVEQGAETAILLALAAAIGA
jgi:adenosylcobinamide-GDP ribazoletransferase